MLVTPIKTHKIKIGEDIFGILDRYVIAKSPAQLNDETIPSGSPRPFSPRDDFKNTILVITSKIISLSQKRVVKIDSADKNKLIKKESSYYLPRSLSRYQVSFTIKNNMLVPTAGIDESNGDGYYILWPQDVQRVANEIREYIVNSSRFTVCGSPYNVIARSSAIQDDEAIPSGSPRPFRPSDDVRKSMNFGVIISDSRTVPLRWGVTAMSIAYSGFNPLKDYIGIPDLYGRPFAFEKLNIADSLAAAAGFVMGEGAEQTPMALITDLPNIEFQDRSPTKEELEALKISLEDDLYAPFLTSVKWKKGDRL